MSRLLLTQSILSDFEWVFRKDDGCADFLRTLRREQKPQTSAMLDGIEFENAVMTIAHDQAVDGSHVDSWIACADEVARECYWGQFQVRLSRELIVDDVTFLCYGVLDCLRAGEIIDIKFSKTYSAGKYIDSPQHPMYFYLCPEARQFVYLVSDGEYVYREMYTPDITEPIELLVRQFMRWMKQRGLWDEYTALWAAKEAA
jgi:hypothetical protein